MRNAQIDPSAKVGVYGGRFAFLEEAPVLERLERAAARHATSSASIVRQALREWLDDEEAK